jgi:hypothetical protein
VLRFGSRGTDVIGWVGYSAVGYGSRGRVGYEIYGFGVIGVIWYGSQGSVLSLWDRCVLFGHGRKFALVWRGLVRFGHIR